MFLKRIVLKNFKSFAGKNILDFPSFVTAIVGPNGSGKSNIVDALRWALGEQKSKNIRIEQGKDLIFSGNQVETAAGFAEVELVFNNSPQVFPLDYSEISITRRIDREGNNNYFLNHQPCHWKDVIKLSAQVKLGLKGLSIVNQGAVENILRVSPFELRMMIEENIGLRDLELKKEEAERKINNTILNLDEARAREQEIAPHLHFLKRQVKRWERREKIEIELKELEKKYFAVIYSRLVGKDQEGEKEKERERIEIIKEEIKQLKREIEKEKVELDQFSSSPRENPVRSLTKLVIQLQNQRSELENKIDGEKHTEGISISPEALKKKLVIFRDKLDALLDVSEIDIIKQGIRDIRQYLNDIIKEKKGISAKSLKEEEDKLSVLKEEIRKKSELLDKYQEKEQAKNKYFQKKFQIVEEKRKKIEVLLREQQRLEISQERLHLHLEDLQRRIKERGYTLEAIISFYSQNKDLVNEANSQFASLEKRILYLQREMGEMGEEDQNVIDEYQDVSSRYDFLSKQIKDLETGIEDSRILKSKLEGQIEKEFSHSLQGINKEFNRYFRLMFRGGTARLERVKISDSPPGIMIRVNVPKTRLKNMEMLSGGEKTLVAISLIFAIINQSHPPLLVVDEIDAALDEENSQRFASILSELSKKTQFIVITHSHLTMNAAQIIYGVTLGKNKTSQLLSIKLEEAESLAEKN